MILGVGLIAFFARVSVIAASPEPRLLAMVALPLAVAALPGWGPRWQFAMNLACLSAFASSEILAPLPDSYSAYRWLWMLAVVAVAQSAAAFRAREQEGARLRCAEIEDVAARRERQIEGIAHDIRSPLAAISGFVSLLQDADLGREERSKALSRIGSIARRMELLIDNIMELDRVRAGKLEPGGRMAHPDAIASEVARGYAEEARNKGTLLVTELKCGSCPDVCRAHLERIFANLLACAVARNSGGEIRLSTRLSEGRLRIEVSDNGASPGPADMARMFDRPDSYESGVGAIKLGLHVTSVLVEALGGKIEPACHGQGLSLIVEIPIASS